MFYILNLASSTFCSGYLGGKDSLFTQAGLERDLSILSFPLSLIGRHVHHTKLFSVVMESHKLFGLAWSGTLIIPISASCVE
jgi:hypothetical protein